MSMSVYIQGKVFLFHRDYGLGWDGIASEAIAQSSVLSEFKNPKSEARNPKQYQNPNFQNSKQAHTWFILFCFGHWYLFRISDFDIRILHF